MNHLFKVATLVYKGSASDVRILNPKVLKIVSETQLAVRSTNSYKGLKSSLFRVSLEPMLLIV